EFGCDENKLVRHPLGIDIKKFTLSNNKIINKPDNKFKILTIARLVKEKGLEYAIEAIDKLRSKNHEIDIEYNIIGEGPLRENLHQIINRRSLKKIVKMHGEQNQENVIDYLNRSHIFLLPSIAESFGLVLLEAQAAGLPVIATSVGGTYEAMIPTETGILIPPKDPDAIADELYALIQDPEKRIKMGFAGKKYVARHYDIETLNDILVKIYQNVINSERNSD
ncbi:glycosyltransferase family 4 protein, partial [Desulfobacterales bacterium]|nr:glycosyltransferase family 4 protein [Desulfobacterales bacterium]